MNNKNQYVVNYNNWQNGQRVACFGRVVEKGRMEVWSEKCMKIDQFSKEKARFQYERYIQGKSYLDKCNPVITVIDYNQSDSLSYTLNKWCRQNYKKIVTEVLVANDDEKFISAKVNRKKNLITIKMYE